MTRGGQNAAAPFTTAAIAASAIAAAAIATALLVALAASAPAAASEAPWSERLDLSGDFRLRYESIDSEGVPERNRGRYRVRINAGIDLYDDLEFVVSLATAADNPVSRNVTFGGNATSDSFGIDLAYVDWRPAEGLEVLAGKMDNPMYVPGRAQLVYDNDLNPSGVAAHWTPGPWFVTGGAFYIRERALADDTMLYHVQAGGDWSLGNATVKAGAGYLKFTNTVGNAPFFFDLPLGNTVDSMNRYVYEYANAEVFAEVSSTLAGLPVRLFAHYTENGEVDSANTGVALGFQLGTAEAAGSWQAAYSWKEVEADAVIGSFTESDFGGGGTDVEGHVFRAVYMLRERLSLSGSLFSNDAVGLRDDLRDYRRLQLDLEFEFP